VFGNAEAYQRFMGRWSRVVAPLLVEFTDLPDAGPVLDIGSGTGSLAFAIAQRKIQSQVLGMDPSKEYVEYANSRNLFPGRVSFEVGNALELPYADSSFQASLSLFVFNFIPDRQRALREAFRVTRPGGRIAAAVWDYSAGMRMLRAFWDSAVSVDLSAEQFDEKHLPLCRAGELSEFWRQIGLENVQELALDLTQQFASFADYWDPFLLGQGPAGAYARSISGDRLQALRDEVKRRLPVAEDDAAFALPARAWAVRGTVPF
jgi:SAM-dependent methyltransferase